MFVTVIIVYDWLVLSPLPLLFDGTSVDVSYVAMSVVYRLVLLGRRMDECIRYNTN